MRISLRSRTCVPQLGLAAALMISASAGTATAGLVVDRGLPDDNLNNTAGGDRSNVAWGFGNNNRYFSGDTFSLDPGLWRIDSLTVWTIAGTPDNGFELGERFDSVTLYGGPDGGVSQQQTGNFSANSSDTDNSNISVQQVQYAGGADYQGSSGSFIQIWEVTFSNLNWLVQGGTDILFGVHGIATDSNDVWFNHASNAALSGTTQDGSNDQYRWFDVENLNTSGGTIDSNGNGWDKSSDINVQVTATAVPEPSTLLAGGLAIVLMAGVGYRNRNRNCDSGRKSGNGA